MTDNPVAIPDYQNGSVHFLYQHNYERCYYMRSDDDGKTFTRPVDITPVFEQFRAEYDWHGDRPRRGTRITAKERQVAGPDLDVTGRTDFPHLPRASTLRHCDNLQ